MTAAATNQMMVMIVRCAAAVHGLPFSVADDVDAATFCQALECAINRREADTYALILELVVKLLRRSEPSRALECVRDGGSLAGAALSASLWHVL
jgi:hypothetical protein